MKKIFKLIALAVISHPTYAYGVTDSIAVDCHTVAMSDSVTIEKKTEIQWSRLGLHTGMFVGAGAIMLEVLELLPENATAWNKSEMRSVPLFKRYKMHFENGPVVDHDNPVFNYLLHPYAGAVYYNAARGAGCNKWQSFLYSFFVSDILWEYGIECFNEIPSVQDLILTPCVGSLIGEGFYIAKKKILSRDYYVCGNRIVGKILCWLLDPFNEFGNLILNKKDTLTVSFTKSKHCKTLSLSYRF